MKTIMIAVLVMAAGLAQAGHGDQSFNAQEKVSGKVDYLALVLDLSSEQKGLVMEAQKTHMENITMIRDNYQPVMNEMQTELEAVRRDATLDCEAQRVKTQEIRGAYKEKLDPMATEMKEQGDVLNTELAGIFTPEQNEKFKQLQALKSGHQKEMKKGFERP